MTIVLFTEDSISGEAIRILARKSIQQYGKSAKIVRRAIKRGDIFKPKKLLAFVNLRSPKTRSKVIICVDSECTDPEITESNLAACKRAARGSSTPVQFVIVVHALETWLAADQNALRVILNMKKEIKAPGNLETICRPERVLKSIYRKQGREFLKARDDLIIAENADPVQIAKHCGSFRRFQELLLDP